MRECVGGDKAAGGGVDTCDLGWGLKHSGLGNDPEGENGRIRWEGQILTPPCR